MFSFENVFLVKARVGRWSDSDVEASQDISWICSMRIFEQAFTLQDVELR